MQHAAKAGNFVANAFLTCMQCSINIILTDPYYAKVAVTVDKQRVSDTNAVKIAIQLLQNVRGAADLAELVHAQWIPTGPHTAESAEVSSLHLKWVSEGGLWLSDSVFRSVIKARTNLVWTGDRKARYFPSDGDPTSNDGSSAFGCPLPSCTLTREESAFHRFTPGECPGTNDIWQQTISAIASYIAARCLSEHTACSATTDAREWWNTTARGLLPELPEYSVLDLPQHPHIFSWDERRNARSDSYLCGNSF